MYDYDFIYEQNFYLCITEEAKELILNVRDCTQALYMHNSLNICSEKNSFTL